MQATVRYDVLIVLEVWAVEVSGLNAFGYTERLNLILHLSSSHNDMYLSDLERESKLTPVRSILICGYFRRGRVYF